MCASSLAPGASAWWPARGCSVGGTNGGETAEMGDLGDLGNLGDMASPSHFHLIMLMMMMMIILCSERQGPRLLSVSKLGGGCFGGREADELIRLLVTWH